MHAVDVAAFAQFGEALGGSAVAHRQSGSDLTRPSGAPVLCDQSVDERGGLVQRGVVVRDV